MLLFGVYTTIMTAISDFNVILMIPIGLGTLFGILIGAKIIDFLLCRYPQATYFSILGLVLGSGPVLFSKIISTGNFSFGLPLFQAIIVLFVGVFLVLIFDSKWLRDKLEEKNGEKFAKL